MLNFSDAIFAFALTLLVLDLRPPEGDATHWTDEMTARFVTFVLSFALVAVFWAGHMAGTRRLKTFDWTVAWINLGVLFAIVLTPFASALLGSSLDPSVSWRIYCAVIIATSFFQSLLSLAIFRDRGRLVGDAGFRERFYRLLRAASPGLAFAAGIAAMEAGREDLARWCWVLIIPILMIAGLIAPPEMSSRKGHAAKGSTK
jgi:uncharacterized membrane protein